jgi:calcium-dependent protein kinase
MQQAVLSYIVGQLVTNDEIESTRDIFHALDSNKDGKLQRQELIAGFRKVYGELAEDEVDKIM